MHVKLKKKYGQNFLIDKNIVNKIINLINQDKLNILEIGPGNGSLTKKIINKKPKNLDLIEIDRDLVDELNKTFCVYNYIKRGWCCSLKNRTAERGAKNGKTCLFKRRK